MAVYAEIVLPSGKFAEIEKITTGHMASAFAHNQGLYGMAVLAALTTKLDGKQMMVDEILAMDFADCTPIFHNLNKQVIAAHKHIEGIA